MVVTVFLVTRNHDASLGAALQSVAGFASEILVVDTGSTDRTVEIAQQSGARVLPFAWDDDFAAASNAAIAAARGEWLLWMNPDEELDSSGIPALTRAIQTPDVFVWQLGVRQMRHPNDASGIVDTQARLIRRDPALNLRGRLHPEFDPPLDELAARRRQSIGNASAILRRHGYLSQPTPDKIRWVVRLLERELADRPGQIGFAIELGRNLLWLNDPRGHEVLGAAADEVRARSGDPFPPSPWVGSLLEYVLSVSPAQYRGTLERGDARSLAEKWFPRTPPVLWAVAADRFLAGDYAAAVTLLERLLLLGRTGGYDGAGGFDPAIVGNSAAVNYGTCCLHLGRWSDARAAFESVLSDPKHVEAARRGMRLAELQQKPATR
jgi:hypothetical protein